MCIVHDPGCTDPIGFLEIEYPYNYCDSTPFQAATQKVFCCLLEKGRIVLREQRYYIKCKDRWLSARESGATLYFL